jgi:hypothetical protein
VAALLDRSQLVFPVHTGGTGADHGLHQFESVEHATKAGFGVGDDRREVIDVALVAGLMSLEYWISSARRKELLMRSTTFGYRIDRIQRLVGVHRRVGVVVGGDLPARQIDRLDAGLDLLHRLAAGQRAEAVDVGLAIDQIPELLGATASDGVFDRERTTQADDIGGRVAALDSLPAGVFRPVFFQFGDLLLFSAHVLPHEKL